MTEAASSISEKAGLPPGVLIHVGKRKVEEVRISVIRYSDTDFFEAECKTVADFLPPADGEEVTWINIDGLHDTSLMTELGEQFGLHSLLLDDVLNTRHRPKLEEFDEHLLLMLKVLGLNETGHTLMSEQVSLVLGRNWLITFQEEEGDLFDIIRRRLREHKGSVRKLGADYLLYRLIDTVVDNYFVITEHFSEATESLEERVLEDSSSEILQEIQDLKKLLLALRKAVSPLREAVSALYKEEFVFIAEHTNRYLRDVYDHIIQLGESIETQRDLLAGIMDLYLSGISNRMNKVMQVLTIIATIFIPLTFIAGIYGMNFDHIPELHWRFSYFVLWGVFLAVGLVMFIFFRRKRWL